MNNFNQAGYTLKELYELKEQGYEYIGNFVNGTQLLTEEDFEKYERESYELNIKEGNLAPEERNFDEWCEGDFADRLIEYIEAMICTLDANESYI